MKKTLFLILSCLTAWPLILNAQNVGIGTTTPSDQLHTTGSVRFQNLSGTSDRALLVDTAGRLKTGTKSTVFRSNTANSNLAIPDNGYTNCMGANSEIEVSGIYMGTPNITVRVNITHPYVGDLALFLVAPNNTDIICLAYVNSSNSDDNFTNTIFTDGGAAFPSGTTGAPFTDVYAPSTFPFGCFNTSANKTSFAGFGANVNGKWKLRVFDRANGDVGTLQDWEMSFDGIAPLTQENIIAGNFSIKSGSPAAGKVLTATNTSGYTQWEYPVPYNTAVSAKLAASTGFSSSGTAQTIPFTITNGYNDQFDDGGNFLNSFNAYKAPAAGTYQFNVHLDISPAVASQTGSLIIRVTGNNGLFLTYFIPTSNGTPIGSIMFSSIGHAKKSESMTVNMLNQSGVPITLGTSSSFSAVRLY